MTESSDRDILVIARSDEVFTFLHLCEHMRLIVQSPVFGKAIQPASIIRSHNFLAKSSIELSKPLSLRKMSTGEASLNEVAR